MIALKTRVRVTDPKNPNVSKRGMKMWSLILKTKKGVKDTSVKGVVSLLVVCCLLFGSLTLGSGTLSLTICKSVKSKHI